MAVEGDYATVAAHPAGDNINILSSRYLSNPSELNILDESAVQIEQEQSSMTIKEDDGVVQVRSPLASVRRRLDSKEERLGWNRFISNRSNKAAANL